MIARGTPSARIHENHHGLMILQASRPVPRPVAGHLQANRSPVGPVAGLDVEYAARLGQRFADHRVHDGSLTGGSQVGGFDRRHDVVQDQQLPQVRARQDPDAALHLHHLHHRLRRAASIRITSAIEPRETP